MSARRQPSPGEVPLATSEAGGAPAAEPAAEGALVVALRWPVRIVVLVLVLPARLARDALVLCGRALRRTVWEPATRSLAWLGRALFVWPWVGLWRYVLVPVGRGLGAVGVWLYRRVFTPLGRGAAAVLRGVGVALGWLGRVLLVVPFDWVHRLLLVPVGRGLGAVGAWLFAYVLTPVGRALAVLGREVAAAVVVCWQVAGRVSRAVFGFLGRVLRVLFVDPSVWVWRHVVTPVGRSLRDHVWRPAGEALRSASRTVRAAVASARATGRQTWADVRRALFGGPRERVTESGARPATGATSPSAPAPLRKSAGR